MDTESDEFKENAKSLTEIFQNALNNKNLDVKVESLKNENISSMVTMSEENRRMQDMMKMYGMAGMGMPMDNSITLVLNANNTLVKYVLNNKENENTNMICEQLFDLALISHKQLSPDEMTKFIERSNKIMTLLTK